MPHLYIPLFLITLLYFLYRHFTEKLNYWKTKNVAGPQPIPFFGNLKDSALRRVPVGLLYKKFYEEFPEEKVVGIYLMKTPAILIRDLEIAKNVLIKDFDVFADRGIKFGEKDMGANLFHADGDTWRVLRARFTPLFTSGKLKNMLHLINERAEKFLEHVELITKDNNEHEVHSLVQKYTQATIAACAFGLDMDTYGQLSDTLKRIDKKIFTVNSSSMLDMLYPGILKKMGGSKFPKEVKEFFFDLTKRIINQRQGKPTERNDFMDLILALRQKEIQCRTKTDENLKLDMNDSVISAQSFVFYAAGYETSASTMGFLLYQLALNSNIQDKVIEELDAVLKKYKGELSLEAISELNYMGKVFDETLRMYPIIDKLKRCAQTDYLVPGTEVMIKKGQIVIVPVHGIHFDEKYYPNPEVFDPERFSAENVAVRHSCAYMPFGLGPRHCIGNFYSILYYTA
ncbi:cytochrome P450 6B1-like [Leguminivora glycinivorella]|uniref:cytochrome P450 6B1-like n=1 Tax=Leguminivora glycinivorella TaxID=1035111 RepID=UPI00200C6F88|nr:cytochrome P450 6B1-like [Leguminivora glycinivorella]